MILRDLLFVIMVCNWCVERLWIVYRWFGTESRSVRWTAFTAKRLNRNITVKFSTFGKIRLIPCFAGEEIWRASFVRLMPGLCFLCLKSLGMNSLKVWLREIYHEWLNYSIGMIRWRVFTSSLIKSLVIHRLELISLRDFMIVCCLSCTKSLKVLRYDCTFGRYGTLIRE